jgi:hypothetical protein
LCLRGITAKLDLVPARTPPLGTGLAAPSRDFIQLIDGVRIGCSTGYMAESRGDWKRLIDVALSTSPSAIELSALSSDELPGLVSFLSAQPSLPFGYISIHAPTKGLVNGIGAYLAMLQKLPRYVGAIVFHPDTIDDPAPLRQLGRSVVFENMDARKAIGQTPESLDELFYLLPEAGFCLDVAHASGIDPTLELAQRLLERHGARLREVHLSSLSESGKHVPLKWLDIRRFAPILDRCRHVPWILEAPPPSASTEADVNAA